MKLPNFSAILKHNYIYVPPCPCCGSEATGRYVKQKKYDKDNKWMIEESYRNGEIIALVPEIGEKNAFCFNCEYTWRARMQNVWLTKDELFHEKQVRGTMDILDTLNSVGDEKKKKDNILIRFMGKR